MVVEALARSLVEVCVERVAFELAALAFLVFRQDLGFGGRKHAIETAKHGHGQHDALVLRRAVRAAQQVSDLPDQVGEVVVVGHCSFGGDTQMGVVVSVARCRADSR